MTRDAEQVDALRRDPSRGPHLLFFTGGTALRPLSRALKLYTHNSIHLVTPFDSGGSSAPLRQAFGMPAIGDVRNRLVALADETTASGPAVYRLFSHRLPTDLPQQELRRHVEQLGEGNDPLLTDIPPLVRDDVCEGIRAFVSRMPDGFDLRGASIGNLILAGGYLRNGRDLHAAIAVVSRSLHVRGVVCPIATVDAQLAARLRDGTAVVGQHLLTGKEVPPLRSPIEELWVELDGERADVTIGERARALIARADLICYPMGSFYTSVLANLLARGVGDAVRANPCPKIYVPSTGEDVEQRGHSIADCAEQIVATLGGPGSLDAVLLDDDPSCYAAEQDADRLTAAGIDVRRDALVTPRSTPRIDPERLARLLVAMA